MVNTNENQVAHISSVAAEEGQPNTYKCIDMIPNSHTNINHRTINSYSLNQLFDASFEPKLQIIKELLYCGTYIFVGPPKIGKSFFMAQLGYHVSKGMDLWDYPVRQGDVLYLALEDDYSRIQQRLFKMFGEEGSDHLFFANEALSIQKGLEEQIELFIKEHKDLTLIIIDTLQKIREAQGDKFSYSTDYDVMSRIKHISDRYNICILIVHHTRKMDAMDSFEMISGTNGIFGAADGAFVLQKKNRTDTKAILNITGRDQPDEALELSFDINRCIWNLEKKRRELPDKLEDPFLVKIADFIGKGEWRGSPTELYEKLNVDFKSVNTFSRYLNIRTMELYQDYNIYCESKRKHEGREILLKYIPPK
ncbi:MAG: AAA family ATPase [Lachnospiraceae bacterium]|nr:AAA family ATPase [Lachnospiraceae bacterium]MDO4966913.1 AAA family ATPase [Lachnospiraceae bacterium]